LPFSFADAHPSRPNEFELYPVVGRPWVRDLSALAKGRPSYFWRLNDQPL